MACYQQRIIIIIKNTKTDIPEKLVELFSPRLAEVPDWITVERLKVAEMCEVRSSGTGQIKDRLEDDLCCELPTGILTVLF